MTPTEANAIACSLRKLGKDALDMLGEGMVEAVSKAALGLVELADHAESEQQERDLDAKALKMWAGNTGNDNSVFWNDLKLCRNWIKDGK